MTDERADQAKDSALTDQLHAQIMNLPTRGPKGTIHTDDYLTGHRDARHAAAELVAAALSAAPPDVYEQRLRAVLDVVNRYLPPDGIAVDLAMSEIIGLVDPWPESAAPPAPEPAWIELTDEDRQAVHDSLPNALDGFMKLWGWWHFAKAIEAKVHEKNTHLSASPLPQEVKALTPDPCPQCKHGGVCKTPTCGRLRSSELMRLYGSGAQVDVALYLQRENRMKCYLCGGTVLWVGSLENNPSTKCESCGATNSQELEEETPEREDDGDNAWFHDPDMGDR